MPEQMRVNSLLNSHCFCRIFKILFYCCITNRFAILLHPQESLRVACPTFCKPCPKQNNAFYYATASWSGLTIEHNIRSHLVKNNTTTSHIQNFTNSCTQFIQQRNQCLIPDSLRIINHHLNFTICQKFSRQLMLFTSDYLEISSLNSCKLNNFLDSY